MKDFLALYTLFRRGGNGVWWSLWQARRIQRKGRRVPPNWWR